LRRWQVKKKLSKYLFNMVPKSTFSRRFYGNFLYFYAADFIEEQDLVALGLFFFCFYIPIFLGAFQDEQTENEQKTTFAPAGRDPVIVG